MKQTFLRVAVLLFGITAAHAGETWNDTYYLRAGNGVWRLDMFRNGTYRVTDPRGDSYSASYNASSRELALLSTRGDRIRHFRYFRTGDTISLTPSDLDNRRGPIDRDSHMLTAMPPRWGESETYGPRPYIPPRPDPWPPGPGPGPFPPRPDPWPPRPEPPRPPRPDPWDREEAVYYWRKSWEYRSESREYYELARINASRREWQRYWVNLDRAERADRWAEYYERKYMQEIYGNNWNYSGSQYYDYLARDAQRRGDSDRYEFYSGRSRSEKSGRSFSPAPSVPPEALRYKPAEYGKPQPGEPGYK